MQILQATRSSTKAAATVAVAVFGQNLQQSISKETLTDFNLAYRNPERETVWER